MKGDWVIERSSGYLGYRCLKCYTWKYKKEEKLRCDCDKKKCNSKPKKGAGSQK